MNIFYVEIFYSCAPSAYTWLIDALYALFIINTLRPRQNGRELFQTIFVKGDYSISIQVSLEIFPKVKLTTTQIWLR